MKNRLLASFVAIGIASFLSSCGSDPAPGSTSFTAAAGNITQALAATNKAQFVSSAKLSTTGTPNGLPSLTGRRDKDQDTEHSAFAACTTLTPASATDADGDGVKTQTTTWACTGITNGSGTETRNGTIVVTDKDDNDAASGYKYAYDVTGNYTATQYNGNYSYKGFWEMVKNATTLSYISDYRGSYSGTEAGQAYDTVGGGNWTYTLTPTTMSTPYVGGTAEYSGFFAYTFANGQYVFNTTGTGIKYSNSCNQYYTEGVVTYTDGAGHKIVLDWGDSACDAPTIKYDGTDIT